MEEKIKHWIMNKLYIKDESKINILNITLEWSTLEYLVVFNYGCGLSTLKIPTHYNLKNPVTI